MDAFLAPFHAEPATFTEANIIQALTALDTDSFTDLLKDLDVESSNDMISKISGIVADIARNSANTAEMAKSDNDTHSVISLTNMRDEYNKHFHAVAMACFLDRMIDEWRVPHSQRVIDTDAWVKDPSVGDLDEDVLATSDDRFKAEHAEVLALMPMKAMFKEFLRETFQFNPAIHAQGSYQPLFDESTGIVNTPAAQASARFYEKMAKKCSSFVVDVAKESTAAAAAAGHVETGVSKLSTKFIEKTIKGKKVRVPVRARATTDSDPDLRDRAEEYIIPLDTFERYNRYIGANLARLHGTTHDLHPHRENSDQCVLIYDTFPTAAAATEYVKNHENDFTDKLLSVKHKYWAFTAATPESHQQIMGKDSALSRSLLARNEIQNRMGAAMSNQRARNARRENMQRNLGADLDSEEKMTETQKEFMRTKASENSAMGLGAADRTEDDEREMFHVPVLRVDGATGKATRTIVKVKENPANQIGDITKQVMEENPDLDLTVKPT